MSHRKILYGYQYLSGRLILKPEEEATVKRVFAMYLDGLSFQKIADTLNGEGIPFSSEDANWNKHKAKRLLQNARYTGTEDYPPIVTCPVFQTVQQQIQERNTRQRESSPASRMIGRFWCAECGNRLTVTAGSAGQDSFHLLCGRCGMETDIRREDLLEQAVRDLREPNAEEAFTPSAEAVRLSNAINRGIEKPEHPEEVSALILQGISARYDCCPDPEADCAMDLPEKERDRILRKIARADIGRDGRLSVTLQNTVQDR